MPLFHFRRIRGKTVESAHNQRRAHFVSGIPSSLLADLLYMRQRALALLQRRQKFGIGALAFDRQITLWCLVKKEERDIDAYLYRDHNWPLSGGGGALV